MTNLPPIPQTWSELSWPQLCGCWQAKMRYGGNADVARAAGLLAVCGLTVDGREPADSRTGESIYRLKDRDGLTDDEARSLHAQFLAYILVPAPPTEDTTGDRFHTKPSFRYDAERAEASVQFWEERLRVESLELSVESSDRKGSAVANCFQRLSSRLGHSSELDGSRCSDNSSLFTLHSSLILFHICFQVWQTAVANFYPSVFPLLFGGGKSDPLHTALTGETDTINAVMKYQGYSSPEQVYNTELPIILGTLNTMSKEAKEIEKMNAKIKRKG